MVTYLIESIGQHGSAYGWLAVGLTVPAIAGGGWLMWATLAAWLLLALSVAGTAWGIMADDIAEDVRVGRKLARIDAARAERQRAAAEAGPQETTGTAG